MSKQPGLGKVYKEGGFRRAYYSLPHKDLKDARKKICMLCYWNEDTFNYRLSGKHPYRIYEAEKLEQFFAERNLNAWTGEPITKAI